MLESLKEKIQSGQEICPEEALWLADKAELRPLLDAAQEITAQCAPRTASGALSPPTIIQVRKYTPWCQRKNACATPGSTKPPG